MSHAVCERKIYPVPGGSFQNFAAVVNVLRNKSAQEVVKFITEIKNEWGTPEELVTDNESEFAGSEVRRFCNDHEIRLHTVSVEAHKSNGRVERVIRTIREGLVKIDPRMMLGHKLSKIASRYNDTRHSSIGCTPNEAWEKEIENVNYENTREGKYAKEFKILKREKFEVGQQVRCSQNENLGKLSKSTKGRFLEDGVVMADCGNDSYLIKKRSAKIIKKKHYDLKGLSPCIGETPSKEGGC